jgi:hypothetical protein
MRKYSYDQFKKTKRTMILLIISISFYKILRISDNLISKVHQICDEPNSYVKILKIVSEYNNQIELDSIVWAFVILKVKTSRDILQGLTKLDHLVKVSIF